jgi:hypothetical protein
MAAPFRAFASNGPVLPGELSADERERLRSAITHRASIMSARTGAAVDHAGVGKRPDHAAPVRAESICRGNSHGWTILPGGFCRIAEQADARAVSMGDGARSADVWVVSDKAVPARRYCRRPIPCGSGASPAWCRAAPPTICSGSAAISSAPRRRCG